jgi:hypothetical protein
MNSDQLQNELLTLNHHFDDMEEALNSGDTQYAILGLKDAREAVSRMSKSLDPSQRKELSRMAEEYKVEDIAGMLTDDPGIFLENPAVGMAARDVAGSVAKDAVGNMMDGDDEADEDSGDDDLDV